MTVYVDDYQYPGRLEGRPVLWSHLLADTRDELHAFAAGIGLKREWFQPKCRAEDAEKCPHWHYDVTEGKRQEAIAAGARPVTYREAGALLRDRRDAMRAAAESAAVQKPPAPPRVKRAARWNSELRRHSWTKDREHFKHCDFCGVVVENKHAADLRTWWQEWTWPGGDVGDNRQGGPVPKCPGPAGADGGGGRGFPVAAPAAS